MIVAFIDEDGSGSIEYNEFAPLMFNYLVEVRPPAAPDPNSSLRTP